MLANVLGEYAPGEAAYEERTSHCIARVPLPIQYSQLYERHVDQLTREKSFIEMSRGAEYIHWRWYRRIGGPHSCCLPNLAYTAREW
jgi:hypothetical protein